MKQESITLYAPGSRVAIHNEIEGLVLSAQVQKGRVIYEIEWWTGRERRTEWFDSWRVEAVKAEAQVIGFK